MIALLSGRIAATSSDSAVVKAGGVGYLVQCHVRTLAWLQEQRKAEITLHIHTSVSEDAIRLYGFESADELRLFGLLTTVERIGPKAALAILGRSDMHTLLTALRDGDVALLATTPGVGRKTAERIVLELRDKVADFLPGSAQPVPLSNQHDSAVGALIGLGFRDIEARNAVAAVRESVTGDDVNTLVAAALRHIDSVGATS